MNSYHKLRQELRHYQIWVKVLATWLLLTAFLSFGVFCMMPYENWHKIAETIVGILAFNLLFVGEIWIVMTLSSPVTKILEKGVGA